MCDTGFGGTACEVPICDGACLFGTCAERDVSQLDASPTLCLCKEGWQGPQCDVAVVLLKTCPAGLLSDNVCDVACLDIADEKDDCTDGSACPCSDELLGDGICHPHCRPDTCSRERQDCDICMECNADVAFLPQCETFCATAELQHEQCSAPVGLQRPDGVCDQAWNTSACRYDFGDCIVNAGATCASGCTSSMLGDVKCDPKCNVAECEFDFGDCETAPTDTTAAPNTTVPLFDDCTLQGCPPWRIGDGFCDVACNSDACGGDASDCMSCSSLNCPAQSVCENGKQSCTCQSGFYGTMCDVCDEHQCAQDMESACCMMELFKVATVMRAGQAAAVM